MNKLKKYVVLSLLALPCAFLAFGTSPALADSVNYSNLIDDQVFDNDATMTATQIDSFLNGFPSSCISSNSTFRAPDPTGYSPSGGYRYGGNVTAGKVIYDAAQAYDLNPQVLLATLQKEQSLVSGGAGCSTLAYAASMGYGCPDNVTSHNYSGVNLYTKNGKTVTSVTGTCVNTKEKAGFSQQIIHAAWLLKFDRMRAEGKVTWAIVKTNWDNTDDLSTCYSGFMAQGTYQRCPSGSSAYYDGYATIDSTSIHMDNGATAALYDYTPHKSGNSHFFTIFTTWFGSTRGTPFFQVSGNGTVYILGAGNTYYSVVSPSELKTYGYGTSFKRILSVSSSYRSSLTYSGNLSLVARFEDDPVYLVNQGNLHHFPSPAMLNAYSYDMSSVSALPIWMTNYLRSSTDMQSVMKLSDGNNVYFVTGGKKRHIINPAAFYNLGSPAYATQASVTLDTAYAAALPTGAPIMMPQTIVKTSDTGVFDIWDGSNLQKITSTAFYDTSLPLDYSAPAYEINQLPTSGAVIDKPVKNSSGSLYLLDHAQKFSVTSGQLSNLGRTTSDFATVSDAFLARLTTKPLSILVRVNGGNPVYELLGGKFYHIYSGNDLASLGFGNTPITNISGPTSSIFPNSGVELLKQGKLIRVNNTNPVYLIDGTFAKKYISSRALLENYGYSMGDVVSVPAYASNAYALTGNLAQISKDGSGNFWLIDSGTRHKISTTMLGATYFNVNQASTLVLSDITLSGIRISSDLTNTLRDSATGKVYSITNGQKHWYTSRASFDSHGGNWSQILDVSSSFLAGIPAGSNL